MKLIGSAAEQQYKKELRQGAQFLLEEDGDPRLIDLLHQEIGAIESAYYLSGYRLSDYHTCSILVNGSTVCHIEMSDEQVEAFDAVSISEYKKGLKKQGQIKLHVALELAASK